ncbi:hypothetical protein BDR04DRAFT_1164736 [Suillus decipiens]|nr:hypothetical protein BDR04DRAFT_1164736 [Suillus decipiens]
MPSLGKHRIKFNSTVFRSIDRTIGITSLLDIISRLQPTYATSSAIDFDLLSGTAPFHYYSSPLDMQINHMPIDKPTHPHTPLHPQKYAISPNIRPPHHVPTCFYYEFSPSTWNKPNPIVTGSKHKAYAARTTQPTPIHISSMRGWDYPLIQLQ